MADFEAVSTDARRFWNFIAILLSSFPLNCFHKRNLFSPADACIIPLLHRICKSQKNAVRHLREQDPVLPAGCSLCLRFSMIVPKRNIVLYLRSFFRFIWKKMRPGSRFCLCGRKSDSGRLKGTPSHRGCPFFCFVYRFAVPAMICSSMDRSEELSAESSPSSSALISPCAVTVTAS